MMRLISPILDLKFLVQSAPSLIISLLGMLCTSYNFKKAIEHQKLRNFPFFFQSSSILGFNGNIELGYVMHLSTKRKMIRNLRNFKGIALANSCFLIFESALVGLLVGILSILSVVSKAKITFKLAIEMLAASLITCFISTLLFVISFIFSLELAVFLSIDPESFLMPVLNALNDILVVRILYIFSIGISNHSILLLIYVICSIIAISFICLYFSFYTTDPIPNLSLDTVAITFLLNLFSGLFVDRFSPLYPMIAPAYPVFAGMGSSIAYIFLHKKFISLECQEIIAMNLKITLLFISLIVSSVYIVTSSYLGVQFSNIFALCFMFMFTFQVLILLKVVDKILKVFIANQKSISSNTVPIIASISDFLAIIILIGISYGISLL